MDYSNYDMLVKNLHDGYRMVTSKENFKWLMNNRDGVSPAFVKVEVTRVDIPDAPIVEMQLRKVTKESTLLRSKAEIDAARQLQKEKGRVTISNEKVAIAEVSKLILPIKMELSDVYEIEDGDADAVITRSDGQLIGVQFSRMNYKDRQSETTLSKSSMDFRKMLGLGFIFIAPFYVNNSLDGCGLWFPEDHPLFSEEFGYGVHVSLYSTKSTYGKGSTIFKNHTYFFPQDLHQFTTKILNYINQPTCTYNINEIRNLISSEPKVKEQRYIEKLRSLLLPSVEYIRPVNTPVDVIVNGCKIQLKLAQCDPRSKSTWKFKYRLYDKFRNRMPYFGNEYDAYGIVIPREAVTNEDKITSIDAYEKFFFFPTRCAGKNTMDFSGFPNQITFTYQRGGSFNCIRLNCPDDDIIVLEEQITESILFKFKEWASRDMIEATTVKKLTEDFEVYKKNAN